MVVATRFSGQLETYCFGVSSLRSSVAYSFQRTRKPPSGEDSVTMMIAQARRRSPAELAGSTSVAPAVPTCVRECSGMVQAIGSVAESIRGSAGSGWPTIKSASAPAMARYAPRARHFGMLAHA